MGVLEVNVTPSLSSGSPLDKRIKTKLVADTLTLKGIRSPELSAAATNQPEAPASKRLRRTNKKGAIAHAAGQTRQTQTSFVDKAAKLSACPNAKDAVKLFDRAAWDLVLEAHDQDMRCGGLMRIYPTA